MTAPPPSRNGVNPVTVFEFSFLLDPLNFLSYLVKPTFHSRTLFRLTLVVFFVPSLISFTEVQFPWRSRHPLGRNLTHSFLPLRRPVNPFFHLVVPEQGRSNSREKGMCVRRDSLWRRKGCRLPTRHRTLSVVILLVERPRTLYLWLKLEKSVCC